ncbi:C2 domain-containing family protein [Striga asiatica]|uniref:C2 domain-containing family protein n=1 Tax=Striga asiatica TaxID=4170 RepID=A0A5A7PR58_STRAF|nr:C2 domain-containing family protein [Striga asiatica]
MDLGVEQGVGLQDLATSAIALHTGDDRVRRQPEQMDSETHSWHYSRNGVRYYSVEDVLVNLRKWLEDGLVRGWKRVEIHIQNKQLLRLLNTRNGFDSNVAVLAADVVVVIG